MHSLFWDTVYNYTNSCQTVLRVKTLLTPEADVQPKKQWLLSVMRVLVSRIM